MVLIMAEDRFRNFKFVIWPEQLPSDIWDKCDEANIKLGISPLHEFDRNYDGDFKKPHYHAVAVFPGKKTFEGAKGIILNLFGLAVNTVFVCDDVGSTVRYFFHLDSPKKYPYPIQGFLEFGGFDVNEYLHTVSDIRKADQEIKQIIFDYDIRYYDDLSDYVSYVNQDLKFAVDQRTVHWTAYLKSRHDKLEKGIRPSPVRKIIDEARKGLI